MNPRYKFSDSDSTYVSEIPAGAVSDGVRYAFDTPFIMPPKAELELTNGEWFLIRISSAGEERIKQEGMWKADRT